MRRKLDGTDDNTRRPSDVRGKREEVREGKKRNTDGCSRDRGPPAPVEDRQYGHRKYRCDFSLLVARSSEAAREKRGSEG
jgi:hypothetical protein